MIAQTPSKTPAAKKSAALPKQASPAKKIAAKAPATKKAAAAKETIKKAASKTAKTSSKKSSPAVEANSGPSNGAVPAQKTPKKRANGHSVISAEQRYQLICTAAYFRAERRGFIGGSPEQDWCEAEIEIDQSLYASPRPSKA